MPRRRSDALATGRDGTNRQRVAGTPARICEANSRTLLREPRVNPLSALFGAAVCVRNELYDRGLITVQRLQGPVVSIGNLTVGGSGKTPFLILLGELLKQRGVAFDVLSRGYRRQTQGVAIIDPSGSAREFGDEPLLMARQ